MHSFIARSVSNCNFHTHEKPCFVKQCFFRLDSFKLLFSWIRLYLAKLPGKFVFGSLTFLGLGIDIGEKNMDKQGRPGVKKMGSKAS